MSKPWEYKRKTNRPTRADKGKKKPPRCNSTVQYQIPAGSTRTEFLDTIKFVRALK